MDLKEKYKLYLESSNLCNKFNKEYNPKPVGNINLNGFLSPVDITQTGFYLMYDAVKKTICKVYIFITGKYKGVEIIPYHMFNSDYIGFKVILNDMEISTAVFVLKYESLCYFKPIYENEKKGILKHFYSGVLYTKDDIYCFYNSSKYSFKDYYKAHKMTDEELKEIEKIYDINKKLSVYGDFYKINNEFKLDSYLFLTPDNENTLLVLGEKTYLNPENITQICTYLGNLLAYKFKGEREHNSKVIDNILKNIINKKVNIFDGKNKMFEDKLVSFAYQVLKIKSLSERKKILKGTIIYYMDKYYIYLGSYQGKTYGAIATMGTSRNELKSFSDFDIFYLLRVSNTKLDYKYHIDILDFNYILRDGVQVMILDDFDTSLLPNLLNKERKV